MDVNQIITGDALEVLSKFPDASIQCCISSPPYYGLRDYGVENQIGLEASPDEYVARLVAVFREVRRTLRDGGTLWLNIGDSYMGGGPHHGDKSPNLVNTGGNRGSATAKDRIRSIPGLKPKDLIGIPWMVAFALRADGWYLRSDIIWSKPNCMPESVEDRPTKSHEYLFLLSKNERYYYDQMAIREPLEASTLERWSNSPLRHPKHDDYFVERDGGKKHIGQLGETGLTPDLKRNKRSVWTVPTFSYPESHFATFPPKLIEPCILAGTSPRACEHCLAPWERVTEQVGETSREKMAIRGTAEYFKAQPRNGQGLDYAGGHGSNTRESITTGWQPTCTCPSEGTGKCIVLDPFMGAGTTALVAIQHGRNYLGIELNPSYIDLANRRINTVQQNLWSTSGSEATA